MSAVAVVVAIVSYQCADLTIDCLRSVDAERSTVDVHIRAIVVDNASGDASLISQAIEAHGWSSWITLIIAPRNGGFAYGNNLAFQRAYEDHPPDYLLMLNPDTVVRKGAIGALVRFLEAHPGVGIAGSSFENLDGSEWPMAFRFPSILGELEHGLQLGLATRVFRPWVGAVHMSQVPQSIDWVPGASMMIRRTVVELDWWLRRKLFPVFRRDRLLLSREESRFFDLVCSTEPRHAYCWTEHKAHRAQCSSQTVTGLLVRVQTSLLCCSSRYTLCDGNRRRCTASAWTRFPQAHCAATCGLWGSTLSCRPRAAQHIVATKP